jgi:hypothetical protein
VKVVTQSFSVPGHEGGVHQSSNSVGIVGANHLALSFLDHSKY